MVVLLVHEVDHDDTEPRAAQAANSADAAGEVGGRVRPQLTNRTERGLGHDHHRPQRRTVVFEDEAAVAVESVGGDLDVDGDAGIGRLATRDLEAGVCSAASPTRSPGRSPSSRAPRPSYTTGSELYVDRGWTAQ